LFSSVSFLVPATLPVDEAVLESSDSNDNDNSSNSDERFRAEELASIVRPCFEKQQPVVVRGAVAKAPATSLWSSWDYWEEATIGENNSNNNDNDSADPLVAVEIGGSYGSEGSERAEIPWSAYLRFLRLFEERHGREGSLPPPPRGGGDEERRRTHAALSSASAAEIPPTEELVYMAQNDLLDPLYKDVVIPGFCGGNDGDEDETKRCTTNAAAIGLGRLYSVMMWLGPRGCVSPLHFDPLDNCLMQHLGRKRVLLFEPSSSAGASGAGTRSSGPGWHYAGHGGNQSNTSPIDPEVLDGTTTTEALDDAAAALEDHEKRFPLFFREAPPRLECVLEPGDLLYIPSRWWHHARSIDTSASVNVWWR